MSPVSHRPVLPFAAAALGVLLTTAGCGVISPVTEPVPAQSSATASVTATASATAGATATATTRAATAAKGSGPDQAQLSAALPQIPAGSTQWPANLGPYGPQTAAQYVAAMFGATEVSTYLPEETRRGLEFGAVQRWSRPDGVLVSVFLGRFAADSGALSAFLAQRSGEQLISHGDPHFTVPGITDSYADETPQLDSSGNAMTNLHAVAGDVLIRVVITAPATPDRTVATQTAEQVYASVCRVTDCAAGGS